MTGDIFDETPHHEDDFSRLWEQFHRTLDIVQGKLTEVIEGQGNAVIELVNAADEHVEVTFAFAALILGDDESVSKVTAQNTLIDLAAGQSTSFRLFGEKLGLKNLDLKTIHLDPEVEVEDEDLSRDYVTDYIYAEYSKLLGENIDLLIQAGDNHWKRELEALKTHVVPLGIFLLSAALSATIARRKLSR